MTDRSGIHFAHGIVTTILFLFGMYLFYNEELHGAPLSAALTGATIGAFSVILLVLYAIHENLGF